jgi:group I intron endonuclease
MIIYQIINKINHKSYIGLTTKSTQERLNQHRQHKKSLISHAIRKYGIDNFIIQELDYGSSIEELNEKESYWIERLDTVSPNGYNLKGGGKYGSLSEYSRKKISKTLSGRKLPPFSKEHKRKISEALKKIDPKSRWGYGKKYSQQHRKRISDALTGKKKSLAMRKKISRLHKGKKISNTHKQRLSFLNSGKNNPMYGKTHSIETRKKISRVHKGKKISKEHLQKISHEIIVNNVLMFYSIKECSRILKLPSSSIRYHINKESYYQNIFKFERL